MTMFPIPADTVTNILGALTSATFVQAQGRVTLTTAVPVLTSTVSAAATVYYTPFNGNVIPIYDGSKYVLMNFAEVSNVLANSSTGKAGPAAGAASKNYDLFVWNDAGTLRLTRGGAWNSATARSSTTENDLQRVGGILTNLNAITNGPGVGLGTYVGSIRTDSGGATVTWSLGTAGTAGTQLANLGLWNMYNRVDVRGNSQQTAAAWTYSSATIRAANNDASTAVQFIRGLNEDGVEAAYACGANTAAAAVAFGQCGLGLDATNAYTGLVAKIICDVNSAATPQAISGTPTGSYSDLPGLGWHTLTACESGDGTNNTTWGVSSASTKFNQLSYTMRA